MIGNFMRYYRSLREKNGYDRDKAHEMTINFIRKTYESIFGEVDEEDVRKTVALIEIKIMAYERRRFNISRRV